MANWFTRHGPIEALSISDRAIHYGDGLFETIAIRDGEPRLWELHMQRLQEGCSRLGIGAPDDVALRAAVVHAINESGVDAKRAIAKIIVSAGSGPRGYRRAARTVSDPLIGIFPATSVSRECYESGIRARLCTTPIAQQPALAGLKTLNRLEQVLARNEWQDGDIFEGLMLDSDGCIICGTMSNVFVIHKQSISTPDLSRSGVAGVMRHHVIDALSAAGTTVRESRLSCDDARGADAMFLSNSQFGVLPVRQLDEHAFAGSTVIRQVIDIVHESGITEPAQ